MSCCCVNETKNVKIRLSRKQLLYDIENYTYIEGDLISTDAEHARHKVIDIAQDGNIDRVNRVLNLAYNECVDILYNYTKKDIDEEETVVTDDVETPEVYEISMKVPATVSMTSINLLKDDIHEYFVYRVIEDWMSIVKPDEQKTWTDKMLKSKKKIGYALSRRTKPIKRKLKPF